MSISRLPNCIRILQPSASCILKRTVFTFVCGIYKVRTQMSISELGNISLELGKLHFGNQAESGVWLGRVAEGLGWGGRRTGWGGGGE